MSASPALPCRDVEYVAGSVLDPSLVDDSARCRSGLSPRRPSRHVDAAKRAISMRSIAAAPRSSSRRRASTASSGFYIARPNPFFSAVRRPNVRLRRPCCRADEMPGPYTRSKMLAEQLAMQAAESGFPVVIGTPTMPIGPHDHNLTPPTAMLRHFLGGRLQLYLDFIVNLVDVRDVAAGLVLAMERGQVGHRYLLGGESMPLKNVLRLSARSAAERALQIPVPGAVAKTVATMLEFIADHVTGALPPAPPRGFGSHCGRARFRTTRRSANLATRPGRWSLPCATLSPIFSSPSRWRKPNIRSHAVATVCQRNAIGNISPACQ